MFPLPLILPIVLHHSERGWSGPTEALPLFGEPARRHPELAEWLPRFKFMVHDLSNKTDEDLRESVPDRASLLAMWALRDGRRGDKMYRWEPVIVLSDEPGPKGHGEQLLAGAPSLFASGEARVELCETRRHLENITEVGAPHLP